MKKQKLKRELVYSPVFDKNIGMRGNPLSTSLIWGNNVHPDDADESKMSGWYKYTIKFDGLIPVFCINIQKIK